MSEPFFESMEMDENVAPRFFNQNNIAIRGIDPIGYFLEGKPVKGSPEFASEYLGFTFYHASEENKALFESNKPKYAPQFGGYCAFAMSKGAVASTIPEAFNIEDVSTVPVNHEIHGELLYLNYSLPVRQAWRSDMEGAVTRAHGYWPDALKTYGPPRS